MSMSKYKNIDIEYVIHAPAFILKEGIGIHASFHLLGTITIKESHAYATGRVAASLSTAPQEFRPTIVPYMRATLSNESGELLMSQSFQDSPQGSIIPTDWQGPMEIFMGCVDFSLPSPPERLFLDVSGTVQYGFDEGFVMARNLLVPHKTFAIEVGE